MSAFQSVVWSRRPASTFNLPTRIEYTSAGIYDDFSYGTNRERVRSTEYGIGGFFLVGSGPVGLAVAGVGSLVDTGLNLSGHVDQGLWQLENRIKDTSAPR